MKKYVYGILLLAFVTFSFAFTDPPLNRCPLTWKTPGESDADVCENGRCTFKTMINLTGATYGICGAE